MAAMGHEHRKLADLLSTREGQVYFLVKFLVQRGSEVAEEFRHRLKKGQPIHARGYNFSEEVITEALQQWEGKGTSTARSPVPESSATERNEGKATGQATGIAATKSREKPEVPRPTQAEPAPQVAQDGVKPGLQSFMNASRRRSISGNLFQPSRDGFLTRTWMEMAEANRRDLKPGVATPQQSRPWLPSPGLATSEKEVSEGLEALKRHCIPSRCPPRKRRCMGRASVGSSASTTDNETSSSAGKMQSGRRSSSEPQSEPSPGKAEVAHPKMPETVKELKALLSQHNIDFSDCVEKSDLQERWRSFCTQNEVPGRQRATASTAPREAQSSPPAKPSTQVTSRDREAQEEVLRILPLRREAFRTTTEWAFTVLGASREPGSVQRSYRNLMRKLHPDKVTITDGVEKTTALIREAKDLCEKSFSKIVCPGAPRGLRYEVLDREMGHRRYRLRWLAPEGCAVAPVSRYLVAALDPAYGKPLTITVLEPDYNEELKRFVSVDELTSFVLAEEDLQKMPSLWKQPTATVQVCAANEAGQSPWSKLEIHIAASRPQTVHVPSSPSSESSSVEASSPGSNFSQDLFSMEIQRRAGRDLQQWLQKQLKAHLVAWLKSQYMPTSGTKQELVDRVLEVMGLAAR